VPNVFLNFDFLTSSNFVEVTNDPLSKINHQKNLHQSSKALLSNHQGSEHSILPVEQVPQDQNGLCELLVCMIRMTRGLELMRARGRKEVMSVNLIL
jgi:hypothetical protein